MQVKIHIQYRGRTVFSVHIDKSPLKKKWHRVAFTLIELIIVLAIVGTLMSVGMPLYKGQLERARVMVCISDIKNMQERIKDFIFEERRLPDTLVEVPGAKRLDPWGNPYEYLRIEGNRDVAKNFWRKDRFLVPINNEYYLYSKGRDGQSEKQLHKDVSHDDIIRANDGIFVGKASEF